MRELQSLNQDQVEHFLEKGYVRLTDCFDRALAEEWTSLAFRRLGYDPMDPNTWEDARVHLPQMNTVDVPEVAPKVWSAICDLMGGDERIKQPVTWSDRFICNFKIGADQPWQPPSPTVQGWHKDGDWFKHFLDSPEQGLLIIGIWSDILPQSGGTFIATDSVSHIARHLATFPEGVRNENAQFGKQIEKCQQFEEVTGEVGDVLLLHPFMLHTASANPSGRARFITNPFVSLNEPMCFNRPDGDYSPVEQAIVNAFGEPFDWEITCERELITPGRIARQAKMLDKQKARLGIA